MKKHRLGTKPKEVLFPMYTLIVAKIDELSIANKKRFNEEIYELSVL